MWFNTIHIYEGVATQDCVVRQHFDRLTGLAGFYRKTHVEAMAYA